MSYTALYRKFRPETFADVKGQDHIVTTLKNQLKASRIGHAYLFTGTRGTGKTTVAKIFAKAVNCENPNENGPCGECETCKAISAGISMNVFEIDAASNNGVDNIREIIDEVAYRPTEGKYKVYIIDEVHMLSTGAFNAMLKTLEEPPEYVIFILATTDVNRLPITVLSRCQRYDFKRISIDTIAARMQELMGIEQVDIEDRALRFIAKAADGSLRDGLSLLDQCIAFNYGEKLTYDKALDVLGAVDTEVFSQMLRNVLERNVAACIELLEVIISQGRDISQFVTDFTWYLRNLMLVQSSDDLEDVIDMSSDNLARLKEEATLAKKNQIIRFIHVFSELSNQIRYASQKRVMVEVALIRLCKPEMDKDDDALWDRIYKLEEQMSSGTFVTNVSAENQTPVSVGRKVMERPKLPAAIPDDVKIIVSQWAKVKSNLDLPLQSLMQNTKPSLDADGNLEIAFQDNALGEMLEEDSHYYDQLSQVFSDMVGKEVTFRIRKVTNPDEYEQGILDLSLINMDITEEDE